MEWHTLVANYQLIPELREPHTVDRSTGDHNTFHDNSGYYMYNIDILQ